MKKLIFTLFFVFPVLCYSQGIGDYIKNNAIELDLATDFDSTVYHAIKNYRLIMVGEMHGTHEPSKFVSELAKLIVKKEGSVSVGMEIPEIELKDFIHAPSKSTLQKSQFFLKENRDGRNGESWFKLIETCMKDERIHLFFFDNHAVLKIESRDSAMFVGVKKQLEQYSDSKIITLSGNIHNWLIPFNGNSTMGSLCTTDTLHFPNGTVCSLNHIYSEGKMYNNTGNGLELKTIGYTGSIFSESTDLENYLLPLKNFPVKQYNFFIYTKKVTASAPLKTD